MSRIALGSGRYRAGGVPEGSPAALKPFVRVNRALPVRAGRQPSRAALVRRAGVGD